MIEIDLVFILYLGRQLERLRHELETWDGGKQEAEEQDMGLSLRTTHGLLAQLSIGAASGSLLMCRDAAEDVMRAIGDVLPALEHRGDRGVSGEFDAEELSGKVDSLQRVLEVELQQLHVFTLGGAGTHDPRILLQTPRASFEEKYWKRLSAIGQNDWEAAAKCLAYDVPTACGFHAMRALEAVALDYLSKLGVTPIKRDLGHYLKLLKENGADSNAVEAAEQLRGLHRNPLMHPEDFLETQDAVDVFDLCRCAIRALLRDMEKRGLS